MVTVQASIVVGRPIGEVFAYAADFRNDAAWRGEVSEIRYLTPDPIAVGSRELETARFFGRTARTETRVTEFEVPRRVAFEHVSGPYRVRGSRTFEAVPDGTRFTFRLESEVSFAFERLLVPLLGRLFQRQMDQNVARLKAILERPGAPEAATVTG
jgi:uncharacterized membrane protein